MYKIFIVLGMFTHACFAVSGLQFIAQFLPDNPIIVEAGAHHGTDTKAMSLQWPKGTIHAFEPRSDVYKKLCAYISQCKNVRTYPFALGEYNGIALFHLSSTSPTYSSNPTLHDGQSSLFSPIKEVWPKDWVTDILFLSQVTVPVVTLDSWAQQNNIQNIDFLWLDVQGPECQILRASPNILKTVKAIKTEFSREPLYEGTVPFAEYKSWLETQGFVCVEEDAGFHGDAIFIRR